MNRTILVSIIAAAVLLVVGCCCCTGSDWGGWGLPLPTLDLSTPGPRPSREPRPTDRAEPTAEVVRTPAGDLGAETEWLLNTTSVPVRDLHDLAVRLSGMPADTPRTVNPDGSPDYAVGERRVFHISNFDTNERFDIYAILEYKTAHAYMWVEEGVAFNQSDLEAAADFFEEHTYVTDRAFFGSEWIPGVDSDPHLSLLHARRLGSSVYGYYSSRDQFVSRVRGDSNEMEMFYISIDNVRINTEQYHCTLAHELQHMIHWHHDRNEDTWMNEGFSELACQLNGLQVTGHDLSFASQPDNQLNDIDYEAADSSASYGAAYLFIAYFLDRFGPEATQELVAHPENSFASVDAVLADSGTGLTHEDLFGDWVIANLLDELAVEDDRYGYGEIDPPSFNVPVFYGASDYPVAESATVHQYGTDYIDLQGPQPLVFRFVGSTHVGLVDAVAHSGRYAWWSNRGDDSDMTLTRAFDLSGLGEATLEFWVWYDIEKDWDYAYVEVSTNDGQTWHILDVPSGTDTNPNGSSFGRAYTGRSGGGARPQWILEKVDLSDYAGGEVLIRFEYVTDDAVNKPGLLLDDVAVPEIGYAADFEAGDDGWEPAGFIRHANVLPQRWLVQLILFGDETTVERLELDGDQVGEWSIPLGEDSCYRAVIVVSALSPVTTELAPYRYEIVEQ